MLLNHDWLVERLLAGLQTGRNALYHLVQEPFIEERHTIPISGRCGGYDAMERRGVVVIRPFFHHIADIDHKCITYWRYRMPGLGWSVENLKAAN